MLIQSLDRAGRTRHGALKVSIHLNIALCVESVTSNQIRMFHPGFRCLLWRSGGPLTAKSHGVFACRSCRCKFRSIGRHFPSGSSALHLVVFEGPYRVEDFDSWKPEDRLLRALFVSAPGWPHWRCAVVGNRPVSRTLPFAANCEQRPTVRWWSTTRGARVDPLLARSSDGCGQRPPRRAACWKIWSSL